MKFLPWDETYAVGIDEIDRQHRHIIQWVAELQEKAERDGCTDEETWNALQSLIAFANEHFSLEEQLMRRVQYPELQEHLDDHQRFRAKVVSLANAAQWDVPVLTEVLVFIDSWLRTHTTGMDMKYKPWLKDIPIV